MRIESTDKRVALRSLKNEDISLIQELANNPKVAANLRDAFPHPYTIDDATKFVDEAIISQPQNRFAILENDIYVGNIGIHLLDDVYSNSAEIGYFIGEPYWNRGIATEALKLAVNYGFEILKLRRIFAGIFSFNPASAKVLEKAGFEYEGTLKAAIIKNGEIYDEIRYGIVNENITITK